MNKIIILLIALSPLSLLTASAHVQAQVQIQEYTVSELNEGDRELMQHMRSTIDDLARRHLGRQLQGTREDDLAILQLLLDRRLVTAADAQTLQAMGVVLGDLYAKELGLKWVIYQDKLGRSKAMQWRQEKTFIYPITMISRRVEAGIKVNVREIYEQSYARMKKVTERTPAMETERRLLGE